MEKILIILLIFGFLLGTMREDIKLRDFDPNDVDVEENKITGNIKIKVKSNREDIYLKFEETISGKPTINLEAP